MGGGGGGEGGWARCWDAGGWGRSVPRCRLPRAVKASRQAQGAHGAAPDKPARGTPQVLGLGLGCQKNPLEEPHKCFQGWHKARRPRGPQGTPLAYQPVPVTTQEAHGVPETAQARPSSKVWAALVSPPCIIAMLSCVLVFNHPALVCDAEVRGCMCSPGALVTAHTEPQGQSSEFQHLQEDMPSWHVPLVPRSLPVSLLGQHVLLLDGQRRPLKSLQLTRDLSDVQFQGPVA
jgi:hypothetical protein